MTDMERSEPIPYPDVIRAIKSSLSVLDDAIEQRCKDAGITVRQMDTLREIQRRIRETKEVSE